MRVMVHYCPFKRFALLIEYPLLRGLCWQGMVDNASGLRDNLLQRGVDLLRWVEQMVHAEQVRDLRCDVQTNQHSRIL